MWQGEVPTGEEGLSCFLDQGRVCGPDCAAYVVEESKSVVPIPCIVLRGAKELPSLLRRALPILERLPK